MSTRPVQQSAAGVSTAISSISQVHGYDVSHPQHAALSGCHGVCACEHICCCKWVPERCSITLQALLQGVWVRDTPLWHHTGGLEGKWVVHGCICTLLVERKWQAGSLSITQVVWHSSRQCCLTEACTCVTCTTSALHCIDVTVGGALVCKGGLDGGAFVHYLG